MKLSELVLKAEKVIGINVTIKAIKSTVDDPYREAPVRIIFGYGIDDIRANLEYIKKMQIQFNFCIFSLKIPSLNMVLLQKTGKISLIL